MKPDFDTIRCIDLFETIGSLRRTANELREQGAFELANAVASAIPDLEQIIRGEEAA